jgi:hypothetical protein
LDAFDAFTENHNRVSKEKKADPIEFLNKHFTNEAALVAQLPFIRSAVSERMQRLDDTISSALQRQSESADATQKHVQDARASVASLEQRVRQVQQKASQSEQTVREITKDMKRLDCAKRHLQRTITTLKRLHMLIHAVEQLRLACLKEPFPDYKSASHLVDAIRLLLRHFEGYKVTPMQLLSQKVTDLHGELKFCLIRAFRVVGFGVQATLELEKDTKKTKYMSMREAVDGEPPKSLSVIMPPNVMADGILMIDALGKDARNEFITVFGQDQLAEYSKLFKPVKKKPKEQKRVSSFKVQPEEEEVKPEYTLEFIEKRFLWFRNMLNSVGEKYPAVFPNYWNIEYLLTKTFLKRVSCVGGRREFHWHYLCRSPVYGTCRPALTFLPCSVDLQWIPMPRMPPFFSRHYKRRFSLKRKFPMPYNESMVPSFEIRPRPRLKSRNPSRKQDHRILQTMTRL